VSGAVGGLAILEYFASEMQIGHLPWLSCAKLSFSSSRAIMPLLLVISMFR